MGIHFTFITKILDDTLLMKIPVELPSTDQMFITKKQKTKKKPSRSVPLFCCFSDNPSFIPRITFLSLLKLIFPLYERSRLLFAKENSGFSA